MSGFASAEVTPRVLFLDDVLEQVEALERECQPDLDTATRSFDDIDEPDLRDVAVIVVDFSLEAWNAKDESSTLALRPADGLAVAEILRSQLRATKAVRPTAFVVLSGELEKLTGPYPASKRPHLVAGLAKVEWAFQKSQPAEETACQLKILAHAVSALPKTWPHELKSTKYETLTHLLGLPNEVTWHSSAAEDVMRCHPPIQELSTWSHGIAFLRWLLQRVIPYPAFLLDENHLAARLGLTVQALKDDRLAKGDLYKLFEECIYVGVLGGFTGLRWWRAGVDAVIWSLTKKDPFRPDAIQQALDRGFKLDGWLKLKEPVPCVDSDYVTNSIAEASDCVQLRPDDWPLFADAAWALRSDVVRSEGLQLALARAQDREEILGGDAHE